MALDPYRRKTKARYVRRVDGGSGRSRVAVVMGAVGFVAMLLLVYNLGQMNFSRAATQLFASHVQTPP